MKAALCKTLEGPSGVVIEDVPEPRPAAGEVLIRVRTAALNFFDTLITRGKYQHKPELPFSPSGEVAGVVAAVGDGVSGFAPGQRVMAYLGWGGARELVVAPAAGVVPIPAGVSDEIACGVSITYGTAIHGLKDRGRVAAGESVAVLGASGGAGLAAVEIARLMGARVIAAGASLAKLEPASERGAHALIDYSSGDLKSALRQAAGPAGLDVVYDCVGGPYAEPALRALAWQGRFLVVGFAAGDIPRLPLNLLLLKGCEAIGVFWGESVKRDPEGHRRHMAQVLQWIEAGRLSPHVHGIFELREIGDAISVLDRREATGKVVIRVG